MSLIITPLVGICRLFFIVLLLLSGSHLYTPALAGEPLRQFAESVMLKSYRELDAKAAELLAATGALGKAPTAAQVETAREAWRAARVPWEHSEAFLFGPVDTEGHDPELDSWPVNVTDLTKVIDEESGPGAIDPAAVKALGEGEKGFHVIEFLLFSDGSGQPAEAADTARALTAIPRKLDYLNAATEVFKARTAALLADYDGAEGFAAQFSAAGTPASPYASPAAAYEEVVNSMAGIADESANVKLLEPTQKNDPTLLESRFSGHTRQDVLLNIDGIAMSYETAIAPALNETNPELAGRVHTAITEYRTAVEALPAPLRDHLGDANTRIEAAAARGNTLRDLFAEDVLPVVQKWN